MAYRSNLTRLFALFALIGLVAAPTYSQDGGANLSENPGAAAGAALKDEGMPDRSPKQIDDNERVRRRRQLIKANRLIKDANVSLKEKEYIDAIDRYTQAEKILKDVSQSTPSVLEKLASLRKTLGQCYNEYALHLIKLAREDVDVSKFDQAEANIAKSIEFDPSLKPQAQYLQKLIHQQREQAEVDQATMAENIDPEYRTRLKRMLIKKAEAKVFADHEVWKRARNAYEDTLLTQPGNQDAITGLRRLYAEMREAAKMRRRAAEAERMSEIEWKWIDPIPAREVQGTGLADETTAAVTTPKVLRRDIHEKLETIVVNKISFEDTPVTTVFEYLKNRSRVLDPEGIGVNFLTILRPDQNASNGAAPKETEGAAGGGFTDDDDFGGGFGDDDDFGGAAAEPAGDAAAAALPTGDSWVEPTITMDFDNIPLGEAVRYICEQAQLRYKVEEHAVVILGKDIERGNLELRFFPIDPRLFTGAGGGDDDDGGGVDYQQFFEQKGVAFPTMDDGDKASISYDRGTSKLIVRNTPDNLRLMDRILREINQAVPQVTIEAKFVEVRQNVLDELSFQWNFIGHDRLGSNATYKMGNTDVGVRPVTPLEATGGVGTGSNLFTATRNVNAVFNNTNAALGEGATLAFDTWIGKLGFETFMYYVDRKDGTDTLSAPKVTVQSGEEAFISMTKERMFPESFEQAEFTQNAGNNSGFTPSSPVFGEPRDDLGVTLTVTPQVATDGISISLELHPKVVEFIEYDTTFNTVTTIGTINPVNIPNIYSTPVFEVREIRTKVTVWDGESVVLGGTITDKLKKVNDKVPLIGDLPLVGKLFQSNGEISLKKNLLMFVSARIVDPSGIPRREHDVRGLPDYRR